MSGELETETIGRTNTGVDDVLSIANIIKHLDVDNEFTR